MVLYPIEWPVDPKVVMLMPDMEETDKCRQTRDLLDKDASGHALVPATSNEVEQHLKACPGCARCYKQVNELISLTAALPQFDVPEALTQRILASINVKQEPAALSGQMIVMALVVIASVIWLAADSVETALGLISWIIGFAGVALLKLLIDTPSGHGKAI